MHLRTTRPTTSGGRVGIGFGLLVCVNAWFLVESGLLVVGLACSDALQLEALQVGERFIFR